MKKLVFAIICLLPVFAIQAKTITVDINDPAADFNSIQDAIKDVNTLGGDTIWVGPGTYKENINFMDKAVTVTGSNPDDPNVISLTIITAEDGYCVSFDFGETSGSKLTGFTIDGNDTCGGIYCYTTSPVIIKNIIKNCTTSGITGENNAKPFIMVNTITSNAQTGIYNCHGLISDNTITHNNVGIAYCNETTTVINNVISDNNNTSPGWGGALYQCDGDIIGNIISNNHAADNGGALYQCHGKVTDNIIVGNKADNLGGGLFSCSGDIGHNIIAANQSQYDGGGLSNCRNGYIYNNTIVGNRAAVGAAMSYCTSPIQNNIIAFNEAGETGGIHGANNNSYNTFWENDGGHFGGGAEAGEGDIIAEPHFADECYWDPNGTPETNDDFWCDGDYHLKSEIGRWDPNIQMWVKDSVTSQCIDAGDPNSDNWKKELWPHGKRTNTGAYGGTVQASMSPLNVGNIIDIGNVADLNFDDVIGYRDMKLFTNKWLRSQVLLYEDLDRDGLVDFADYAILVDNWQPLLPPSPNPMTWATEPNAAWDSTIEMEATVAAPSDGSIGVEYYFEETSGNPGGSDSGWLVSNTYIDDDLSPGTEYSYRVKVRNINNKHETKFSAIRSAITFSPPSPNPMTWAMEPNAASGNSITMEATVADSTDGSGVQYYFDETSGYPGGSDSGWQSEPSYTDFGLAPFTQYCYRVMARNTGNQLETGFSEELCATTPTDDTTAPSPILWEIEPHEVWHGGSAFNYWAEMEAEEATDDSGGDVWYFFECTTEPDYNSDWQIECEYKVLVGMWHQGHWFRFKARDEYGNESDWSSELQSH